MLTLALVVMMSPTPTAAGAADPVKPAKQKPNEPDLAKPNVMKDDPATDKRFTERVTVRRYVGQSDFDFLIPNANVPALRREAVTSRDGKTKQMRYYLHFGPTVQPKSEIIAEDGSVWEVKTHSKHYELNLKDGKGPLYSDVMDVTLKSPAPTKK